MSVRATERLIGDAAVVTAQEGTFPASALDRIEVKKSVSSKKSAKK